MSTNAPISEKISPVRFRPERTASKALK